HTKNIYNNYVEGEDYVGGGSVPEDMLLIRDFISSPQNFAMLSYSWNEPITLVGLPTTDGRPLYSIDVSDAVCIVSGSDNPDGAWEFLEYYLTKAEHSPYSFSCRKDILQQSVEEETVPLYDRDANGEIIIYEHFSVPGTGGWTEHWNEPMMQWRCILNIDGMQFYYYYMEQETADTLLEILENLDFTPQPMLTGEIIDIIMEEAAPCLAGDKTIETAAGIIQNRVQTLIQEGL
ncbi:MAG: hypothetical protein HDR26_02100, partial [Lachnospiraceae bacterium]|nr:hypothetical protein [Lachnospiraceae bacterium]